MTVVRQMIEKLARGIDSLLAGRRAGYNDALAALRYLRRIVNEVAEVVPMDFLSNGSEQNGFLRGRTP